LSRPWLKDKPELPKPNDGYRVRFDDLLLDSFKTM